MKSSSLLLLAKKINLLLALSSLFIYGAYRFYNRFILVSNSKGDENGFEAIFLVFISKNGFYEANVIGNSTFFNVISYIFYYISNNVMLSLRLTTFSFGILTFIAIIYFQKKFFNLNKEYSLLAKVTVLNIMIISTYVFTGYNDQILSFLTVVFFIIMFRIKNNLGKALFHSIILGTIMALFFSTRLLTLVMLPSMFIVVFIVIRVSNNKLIDIFTNKIKYLLIGVFTFSILMFTFNYPSIIEKGKLSFHSKEGVYNGVNWTQMQYLAAMGQAKGDLPLKKHYTWKQVEEYLKINGQDSLPKNMSEAIFWDLPFTIVEFFKDFALTTIPFTRLIGFLYPLGIFTFLIMLVSNKLNFLRRIIFNEIFMYFFIYTSILSFIIISNVENRWLLNILIFLPMLILSNLPKKINIFNKNIKLQDWVINLQYASITVMNLPFLIANVF